MKYFLFLLATAFTFISNFSHSQFCSATALVNMGTLTPTTTFQNVTAAASAKRYWTFTATAGCTYDFSTCNSINTNDTYLRLYSSATGGTVLAQNDDAGPFCAGTKASLTWVCPANGTYSILVTNYSCANLSASTILSHRVTCGAPPYNPCSSITTISACGTSVSTTMSGTGAGWNITSCGFSTPGQERVFQFTPTTTGTYTLNVTSITGGYVDFFWKPASGGCGSTGWNCIDDINITGSYGALTPMTFTAGTTYYILLDPETSGSYNITFNLGCPVSAPANDLICNATTINCGQTLTGTTVNSTLTGTGEGGACGTSQTTGGVWYKIVGNGDLMTASLCATLWDSKISVFQGTCGAPVCVGGIDDNGPACAGSSASYSWTSTVGVTYFILVHGYSSTSSFSLNLTCSPPPANNNCSSATPLTLQCAGSTINTSGTTLGATEDPIADPSCDAGDIRDVWYSFNTGNNTQIDITAGLGTATWLGVELFTSCGVVAVGPSVTCDFYLLSPNPTTITGLSMNTTYLLRIFTNATYDTPGSFTIRLNTINNTLTLSSAASSQSACVDNVMPNITFNTTGATGATFSGLPPGINGSWSNNSITISGTPTTAGTYNYSVNTSGGCGTVSSFGQIEVIPLIPTLSSISGSTMITPGISETYSITPVSGATYVWEYTESSTTPNWITIPSSNSSSIAFTWPPNTTDGALRVTASNTCNSESRILLISVSNPLPIELLTFSGSPFENKVLLEWSTATEYNNDYYFIERSIDGTNWNRISEVDAAGNSTTVLNYATFDDQPKSGINYYRLTQVDYDGQYETFSPIAVNIISSQIDCEFVFLDMNGKEVNLINCPTGVYIKKCGSTLTKFFKF